MQQHTVSQGGQRTTRRRRSTEPVRSHIVHVCNSPAALNFNVSGMLTAALAIAAAALFYHGAGSNIIVGSGFGCLSGAVMLQVVARRRLRDELIRDARQHGAEDPEADGRTSLARWLEQR